MVSVGVIDLKLRGCCGVKRKCEAVRKWLLKAASVEENPYMQAELIYLALEGC